MADSLIIDLDTCVVGFKGSENVIKVGDEIQGLTPCHISEIKNGDAFYLVVNSQATDLYLAHSDAAKTPKGWEIEYALYQ